MSEIPDELIDDFITEQRLPLSYREQARDWILPLAWILRDLAERCAGKPLLIGVSGAQGSGKSTLATLLPRMLSSWDLSVASLSMDDFYLTRARRLALAESVHPLLGTRGVPGTHELDLLDSVIAALCTAESGEPLSIPVFDKALDDRIEAREWSGGKPDLILLEGWFVGLEPQSPGELEQTVNQLESEEDANGDWRKFVNASLAEYHERIFSALDRLIFLCAPDFDSVYRWRGLQEQKLLERAGSKGPAIMDEAQLRRFIQHYERLTRHALATLPEHADWMFVLEESQQIVARVDRLAGSGAFDQAATVSKQWLDPDPQHQD